MYSVGVGVTGGSGGISFSSFKNYTNAPSIKKLNDNGDYLGVFTDIDKSREDENNKSTAYWSL